MIEIKTDFDLPIAQRELPALPLEGVSAEQLKAMQDYAKKLRRNSPSMKPARLQRKVAEHFKIKIV